MPAKNVVSGALLGFKVGEQSTVDTMLAAGASAGAQHGCFYLTKDSHRLYIGNEDGSLSALNEGIETVANMSALTDIANAAAASGGIGLKALTGRFYYDTADNILCVYNGARWVQLNEDTDTKIGTHTYSVSAASDVATITNGIGLTDKSGTTAGSKNATITVTGANGLKITGSGTAMTITGDTYTLSSADSATANSVDIKVDSTNTNNDSKITLSPGANTSITRDSTTGNISIASSDTKVTSVTGSAESAGFKFTVASSDSSSKSGTIDPKVAVYTSSDANATATKSVSFVNGTATLDVYSRAAVDAKLFAVNAMTYKGTLGSGGTAATEFTYSDGTTIVKNGSNNVPVSIGDTFLTLAAGTYKNQAYGIGSLLIVRAKEGKTEGSDGIIANGDWEFDIVDEKATVDTTYALKSVYANNSEVTNGIVLHASTGGDVGAFIVTAGSNNGWINISEATSGSGNNVTKTLTVTHKDVTRTNTTGTAVSQGAKGSVVIPVITGVTSDAKGHITGVETTNYTLKDTNATLDSMTTATSAYNTTGSGSYSAGVITTTTKLKQSDNSTSGTNTQSTSVVLSSSSLTISDEDTRGTTSSGAATSGLKLEMVWGSF